MSKIKAALLATAWFVGIAGACVGFAFLIHAHEWIGAVIILGGGFGILFVCGWMALYELFRGR